MDERIPTGRLGRTRVGFDLVEVERFRAALERHPGLVSRVFTPREIAYCEARGDPVLHLAARFAAKEAVGKLLGTGVLRWQEIEIAHELHPRGPTRVHLHGRTAELAGGSDRVAVSLAHTDSVAGACVAVVAWEGEEMRGSNKSRCCSRGGYHPLPECCHEHPGDHERDGRVIDGLYSLTERAAVFTPSQMRELDRATIEEVGVPGPVLMERAALGLTTLIRRRYAGRHTLIVCGSGNNGGDGLAAARQLHLLGQPVACIVAAPSANALSQDAALNFKAATKVGVNLRLGEVPDYLWDEAEVVVDCLLGTGASGELRGKVAEWAALINAAAARGVPVVACDVPSGVEATSGSVARGAVVADVTVTFHAAKSGLVCPPGSEAAGEVLVWDIGIPTSLEPEPDLWVVGEDDVNLPGRRVDDHKYKAGYVAVLAGSRAYPGAAWLAAEAAYRTGAGYVRLLMPSEAASAVRGRLVHTVLTEVGPGEAFVAPEQAMAVLADGRLGALVCGPGLGREEATAAAVRQVILGTTIPTVLDADGLFAFSGRAEDLRGRPHLVLTPHAGELATLLGVPVAEVTAAHLPAARRAAVATGQVVLLKGSSTVVADPEGRTRVVVQGPPQLASAGTGDVLAGVIGALLAKGLEPFEAAYAGAWLHAEAGLLGAETDPQGVLAGDLLDWLRLVVPERIYERRPSWTT